MLACPLSSPLLCPWTWPGLAYARRPDFHGDAKFLRTKQRFHKQRSRVLRPSSRMARCAVVKCTVPSTACALAFVWISPPPKGSAPSRRNGLDVRSAAAEARRAHARAKFWRCSPRQPPGASGLAFQTPARSLPWFGDWHDFLRGTARLREPRWAPLPGGTLTRATSHMAVTMKRRPGEGSESHPVLAG